MLNYILGVNENIVYTVKKSAYSVKHNRKIQEYCLVENGKFFITLKYNVYNTR